jgi:hypothetical protein
VEGLRLRHRIWEEGDGWREEDVNGRETDGESVRDGGSGRGIAGRDGQTGRLGGLGLAGLAGS